MKRFSPDQQRVVLLLSAVLAILCLYRFLSLPWIGPLVGAAAGRYRDWLDTSVKAVSAVSSG